MRRSRRGGSSGFEFASSGEDSFVAVVVTKLTGALLFILLLTMVIMALIPKATELGQESREKPDPTTEPSRPLAITTPEVLPEAIAGRPYRLTLAASGVQGEPRWSLIGEHPEWINVDPTTGELAGTPPTPSEAALPLTLKLADSTHSATRMTQIAVLTAQPPEPPFSWARLRRAAVPWEAWMEQGVGFLILWLVYLVGMNVISSLERGALSQSALGDDLGVAEATLTRRFTVYRIVVRAATLAITVTLLAWLIIPPSIGR